MHNIHITKSLFTVGQRCHKALYLNTHSPHLKPPTTSLESKTLEIGKEVGQAARKTISNGVLIKSLNTTQALHETQQAIEAGALTLYEAAFSYGDILIKVDILSRDAVDKPWDFYEVKATTYHGCNKQQRQEYRNDIGIQVWVLRQIGLPLRRISLMHLNRECCYPDLDNLFLCVDYSTEIAPVLTDIEYDLSVLRTILNQTTETKISIGSQCEKPRPCPYKSHCWKDIPQQSLFNLPKNTRKWEMYEQGHVSVDSTAVSDFKSDVQQRALQCYQDKQRYFNPKTITELLSLWKYPLTYLDFEAIDFAIPRFPGTRPYQHIPFQFSCHIQRTVSAKLEHVEFLWTSEDDPRPAFIQELLAKVPPVGSIIVYCARYESTRLKELAEDFPQFREQLTNIKDRLVDLMVVVQEGVYYPEFNGSFSIKKVAPAILGADASYASLEISDGIEAMLAFQRLISFPHEDLDGNSLIKAMLEYCKSDTLLMVRLHQWLVSEAKEHS